MCIIIVTTSHPSYPLILLSNRDEFLDRSTAPAAWWDPPEQHILSGRDREREPHGTWLGITKQGRIAALTNFRDPDAPSSGKESWVGTRSRGAIPNAFLTTDPASQESSAEFAERLLGAEGSFEGIGGFSFVFGRVSKREGASKLGIISNRTQGAGGVVWVDQETWALSNSHYGDRQWPKVVHGEEKLKQVVARAENAGNGSERGEDGGGAGTANGDYDEAKDEARFLDELFAILSVDTLPRRTPNEDWDEYTLQLRNSIFIPPLGSNDDDVDTLHQSQRNGSATTHADNEDKANGNMPSKRYGTQRQSVILVDHDGKVTFVEKTLVDDHGCLVNGDATVRRFDFQIEGWGE